jgi:branched-chain amino acid transport system ATP-binding protein
VDGRAADGRRAAEGRGVSALLEVRGLRKAFADFTAVAGVDLALPQGGITAVIGPNGAGKTTLINLLTGKLVPDEGHVLLEGADVTRLPPSARVRAGMARTFQVTNIFPQLTAEENVAVPLLAKAGRALVALRALDGMPDVHGRARQMLAEVGLSDRAKRPAAELSHGDRRLLEIALALATGPRLLLLDEPTAGMGSGERDRVLAEIRRLAAGGLTILLVEHDMDVVFGMATRIVVLHQGKVLADGAPQAIREDARVREIYLGEPTSAPAAPPAPRPAVDAQPLLEVERLNAGYGLSHVLHEVGFRIARGEFVALLGRNGVGKTTTLRSLAGLTPPFPGSSVRLAGEEIAGRAPEAIAASGVSYVPDDRRIFPDLTGRENLRVPVLALHRRGGRWTEKEIAALFPPLAAAWDRKGRHLSGGEQKMLAIARALMTDPVLLLLDEPSEGLSPLIVRILVDALVRIREGGVTVLAADQNLMFARAVADRALVMERGRLVHAATRDDLARNDPALQRLLAV